MSQGGANGGHGGGPGGTVPGQPDPAALATPPPAAGKVAGGSVRPDADILPRGTMVDGKYAVDRVLGSGGMGVVYLARDVHTGLEVVLKAIRPHLAHRADVRERVIAEGRALGQIDHPNVVHLKSVVTDHNGLFLVMPHIDGESLDRTLKAHTARGQRMPVAEALRLFRMILAGVGAAHAEGVIHRDLKPANVLLRRKDGVAKVTDFGIAKAEEQARAGAGNTKGVIGSLWYMSPEQVQGRRDLDKRVDIYSLGILLYELLTGHVPFRGESSYDIMKMHVDQPLPSVRAERGDAPAWLDTLLAKACAKSRDDRFPNCDAFLAALDHAERSAGATAPGATGAPSAALTGTADEVPLVTSAAAASVVAGTGVGGAATGPGTSMTGERARQRPRAAPYIAVLGLTLVGVGVTAAYFLGNAGQRQRPQLREVSPWATAGGPALGGTGNPIATAAPTTGPSATVETPEAALAKLVGRWKSESGNTFDAVQAGDVLEFRVVDPTQLLPQDYAANEPRFVLRTIDGETSTFAVEDKVRPYPPARSRFDSQKARLTCQENWTEASGRPLRAHFDGTRLGVDAAKIEPQQTNFTRGPGDIIIGCVGLSKLKASVVKTTLTRE